jgi:hypothetical protein
MPKVSQPSLAFALIGTIAAPNTHRSRQMSVLDGRR